MPITKVPVVHKFGIISQSQRIELQERLLQQSYELSLKSKKVQISQRNPFEVTEEFIQQYNNAPNLEEKEHCEEIGRKMLERAKRRAGIRNCGIGDHVNLPMAWTELAMLAQCKGQMEEECLDVLIASLDISPLGKYQIPALFFLAEIMLYWLRTEAFYQQYLRTSEIKLLKMGQLVFQRLFYHHMVGQLQGHSDFKNRLFMYTDGLAGFQHIYDPYPNALLSLRFIIEVSKIILADAVIDAGEVKEADNLHNIPKYNEDKVNLETKEMDKKETKNKEVFAAHSGAISSSVHDLSPTLWHALDLWRCINSISGGIQDALKALAKCGLGLANESWVDGVIALNILADSARSSIAAMKVLHNLAKGVWATDHLLTPPLGSHYGHSGTFSSNGINDMVIQKQLSSQDSFFSFKPSLSDIYEHSKDGDQGRKFGLLTSATRSQSVTTSSCSRSSPTSKQGTSASQTGDENSSETLGSPYAKDIPLKESSEHRPTKSCEVSFDEATPELQHGDGKNKKSGPFKKYLHTANFFQQQSTDSGQRSTRSDTAVGTGTRPEVGSEFFTNRGSNASSVPTFTNIPLTDLPGINGWNWEVAFTYADMLANICIHGRSASIQKMALVGTHKEMLDPYHHQVTTDQVPSAGLLNLATFHVVSEAHDGEGLNDWSWRVRFGAIQALVKVVNCLQGDKSKEGLRTTAWNALLRVNTMEKDSRVLEALQVGQVHTNLEKLLGKEATENYTSIGSRIGAGLSVIYLPPLPPPIDLSAPKARHHKAAKKQLHHRPSHKQSLRTSLKQELDLASTLQQPPVNYNTRTSFDLRRIVEDQWRKEMQKNLEDEEEERRKKLEVKQKDQEGLQRLTELNRAQKLLSLERK